MKLIACCKVVHDEQDITTRPDRTLATDNAGLKISLYDLNAIETAVEFTQGKPKYSPTAKPVCCAYKSPEPSPKTNKSKPTFCAANVLVLF